MAAKGRIEIRIKFNGIPMAHPDSRGLTKIEVLSEGYIVFADIKTKTYKRFLETARELAGDWEGALSGKLERIHGCQIILSNAGLQCYEKKSKNSDASF